MVSENIPVIQMAITSATSIVARYIDDSEVQDATLPPEYCVHVYKLHQVICH